MGNSRARSEIEIKNRKQEIINACRSIYLSSGYDAVNIKEIASLISLSRTAIYTYYKTKEEIFLDVLIQEFGNWKEDLESGYHAIEPGDKVAYCYFITDLLLNHSTLLHLMAEQYDLIENNSRFEKLSAYKTSVFPVFDSFLNITKEIFPNSTSTSLDHFRIYIFSSIGPLYSLSNPTKKQISAIEKTKFHRVLNFRELFYEHAIMVSRDLVI